MQDLCIKDFGIFNPFLQLLLLTPTGNLEGNQEGPLGRNGLSISDSAKLIRIVCSFSLIVYLHNKNLNMTLQLEILLIK